LATTLVGDLAGEAISLVDLLRGDRGGEGLVAA
jgi:hypothetical protein